MLSLDEKKLKSSLILLHNNFANLTHANLPICSNLQKSIRTKICNFPVLFTWKRLQQELDDVNVAMVTSDEEGAVPIGRPQPEVGARLWNSFF